MHDFPHAYTRLGSRNFTCESKLLEGQRSDRIFSCKDFTPPMPHPTDAIYVWPRVARQWVIPRRLNFIYTLTHQWFFTRRPYGSMKGRPKGLCDPGPICTYIYANLYTRFPQILGNTGKRQTAATVSSRSRAPKPHSTTRQTPYRNDCVESVKGAPRP
jgi:hypothetical protein